MIKLENNIPIPPVQRTQFKGGSALTEFTRLLKIMPVGTSFVIDKEKTSISGAISSIKKRHDDSLKFVTRKIGEPCTYRIWRIK